MYLGYLTEDAYDKLFQEIEHNFEKYTESDAWLHAYFGSKEYYKISKSVNVGAFKPHYTPGHKTDAQKSAEDLINVRLLYDAFRGLTPLQASNKYVWTYLCHENVECRKYIIDRWMEKPSIGTVKTRFFVEKPANLLNDNALSRLWWYGYLTYDPDSANPYALTEILLMNQTICTDVIDTLNRMSFQRIKGVLLALKDFKEEIGEKEGITDYFRGCVKYLNHYAASTTMEMLEYGEIQKLAYDFLIKSRENIKNDAGASIN